MEKHATPFNNNDRHAIYRIGQACWWLRQAEPTKDFYRKKRRDLATKLHDALDDIRLDLPKEWTAPDPEGEGSDPS